MDLPNCTKSHFKQGTAKCCAFVVCHPSARIRKAPDSIVTTNNWSIFLLRGSDPGFSLSDGKKQRVTSPASNERRVLERFELVEADVISTFHFVQMTIFTQNNWSIFLLRGSVTGFSLSDGKKQRVPMYSPAQLQLRVESWKDLNWLKQTFWTGHTR